MMISHSEDYLIKLFSVNMVIMDYSLPPTTPVKDSYVIYDDISEHRYGYELVDNVIKNHALRNDMIFIRLSDIDTFELDISESLSFVKETTRMNISFRVHKSGEFVSYKFLQLSGYNTLVDKLKELKAC